MGTPELFHELMEKGKMHSDGIELGYAQAKGELTMRTTLMECGDPAPTNIHRMVGGGHRAEDGVSQAAVTLDKGCVILTYLTHIGNDEEEAFSETFSDYCLLANEWRSVLEEFGPAEESLT